MPAAPAATALFFLDRDLDRDLERALERALPASPGTVRVGEVANCFSVGGRGLRPRVELDLPMTTDSRRTGGSTSVVCGCGRSSVGGYYEYVVEVKGRTRRSGQSFPKLGKENGAVKERAEERRKRIGGEKPNQKMLIC